MPNTYCTAADLIQQYGAAKLRDILNIEDSSTNVQTQPAVTAAVEAANSIVDSYVRAQSALPLKTDVPFLRTLAAGEAYWQLLRGQPSKISEDDRDDHRDVREDLEKVAKGEFDLPFEELHEENKEAAPVTFTPVNGDATNNTGINAQTFWSNW